MSVATLYIATSSAGKLRDFRTAAARSGAVGIEPLPGLSAIEAPEETGATFLANAELKARYYAERATGLYVLADDSGLEVDLLAGAPGVYSARYAEQQGCYRDGAGDKDEQNNRCLLAALASAFAASSAVRARYRCVLAVAQDGRVLATAEGSVEGEIIRSACGQGGFGYDPYFFLSEPGRTMAELDAETRLRLNHRGRALEQLLPRLPALL